MNIEDKRRKIMDTVCHAFNVTPDRLKSRSRGKEVHDARCVYSYLIRHHVGDTYLRIASELNKHHTVVMAQIQRMNDLIFIKDPAAVVLKDIERNLLNP